MTRNTHPLQVQPEPNGLASVLADMKPVAIFRFSFSEGPGYFAECLDRVGRPWRLISVDADARIPSPGEVHDYAGICLMGGPMSVNDHLPWIPEVVAVIREAFVHEIPMIGHCLGGQLISKALGARVRLNPVKEIGWSRLFPARSAEAKTWLGNFSDAPFTVFQWHGETFDLPMQARLIATNDHCKHQIYTLGPHLAMQCHIEMTSEMISGWCTQWAAELAQKSDSVQEPSDILRQMSGQLPELRRLADTLYSHWIGQLSQHA